MPNQTYGLLLRIRLLFSRLPHASRLENHDAGASGFERFFQDVGKLRSYVPKAHTGVGHFRPIRGPGDTEEIDLEDLRMKLHMSAPFEKSVTHPEVQISHIATWAAYKLSLRNLLER